MALQFPVYAAGSFYQVYIRFGLYALLTNLGGVALVFCMFVAQAAWIGRTRERAAKATDKRCRAMEEMLSAIKIVKMFTRLD